MNQPTGSRSHLAKRHQRQIRAAARLEKAPSRTPAARLEALNKAGLTATKERAKLARLLAAPTKQSKQ